MTDTDEPIRTEQGDERTTAAREIGDDGDAADEEPAQDESMEGGRSVKIRDTQIDLSALTAHFTNVSLRTGAAASIALSHDEVEHGDGIPHAQRPEFRSDYALCTSRLRPQRLAQTAFRISLLMSPKYGLS